MAPVKHSEHIEETTASFINLLIDLGYEPKDILDGMDAALDDFEKLFSNFQS